MIQVVYQDPLCDSIRPRTRHDRWSEVRGRHSTRQLITDILIVIRLYSVHSAAYPGPSVGDRSDRRSLIQFHLRSKIRMCDGIGFTVLRSTHEESRFQSHILILLTKITRPQDTQLHVQTSTRQRDYGFTVDETESQQSEHVTSTRVEETCSSHRSTPELGSRRRS